MKLSKPQAWLRSALLAVPVAAAPLVLSQLQSDLGYTPLAAAVAEEKKADTRETRKTPALRNKVYEQLSEAQAAAEAQDYNQAASILDKMLAGRRDNELNSYELANVYNLYAFVHYSRENYGKALQAYENVIKQPDIPVAMEVSTRYTIAQLYFVQERWKDGVNALNEWFKMTDKPSPAAYNLLAQGYYQMKDYDKSLVNIRKAINMYREEGKVPKEQWLNLARYLYFEKGDVKNAVATLEELLVHYPKKDYWVQLSHMYGEQKKEGDQLAALETAYVQGMLEKGPEQVTMASLYLNASVPYKAAKVMNKGLEGKSVQSTSKNWELLGIAYSQAQETKEAIPALEKAASMSDSGELYSRLGSVYLDGEQYDKAISSLNKGLQRGGVKRPDLARLMLGMAYFNEKKYAKAREAFVAAGKDKRSEQTASQWIKYMDSELERQKKIQEG